MPRLLAALSPVLLALLMTYLPRAAAAAAEPSLASLEVNLLRDAEHGFDADAAWAAVARGEFVPLPNPRASFGFTRDALWLHLRIAPDATIGTSRVLVIEQPRL